MRETLARLEADAADLSSDDPRVRAIAVVRESLARVEANGEEAVMAIEDGGPAFPPHVAEIHGIATHSGEFGMPGMSLRDYFAGQALIAMADELFARHFEDVRDLHVAQRAYAIADAMLKARTVEPVTGIDHGRD